MDKNARAIEYMQKLDRDVTPGRLGSFIKFFADRRALTVWEKFQSRRAAGIGIRCRYDNRELTHVRTLEHLADLHQLLKQDYQEALDTLASPPQLSDCYLAMFAEQLCRIGLMCVDGLEYYVNELNKRFPDRAGDARHRRHLAKWLDIREPPGDRKP